MADTLRTIVQRLTLAGAVSSPTNMTASSGSTTTFASTTATFDKTSSTAYQGRVLWVTYDGGAAGAAPEGEARVVSTFSGSTLTVPAFSAAIASTDLASLLPPGWGKDMVLDAVNDTIRTCALPRYVAASLLADGDMETSGTSLWSTTGGGTLSKVTTAALVWSGKQSLQISVTADGHGAASASVPVQDEQIFVSVVLQLSASSKEAEVKLYDVTNATAIETRTVTAAGWTEVRFSASTPAGCENVEVHVNSNSTGTWAIYVDYVSILGSKHGLLTPPASITDVARIEGIYYPEWSQSGQDDDCYVPESGKFVPWRNGTEWRDYDGIVPQRMWVDPGVYPLFWMFRATETALSAMTDTTVFPLEVLIEGALANIYMRIYNRFDDMKDLDRAQRASRRFAAGLGELGLAQPIQRMSVQRRVAG